MAAHRMQPPSVYRRHDLHRLNCFVDLKGRKSHLLYCLLWLVKTGKDGTERLSEP